MAHPGRRAWPRGLWAALAALGVASAVAAPAAAAPPRTAGAKAQVKLLETGSTLLYPLFNLWVPAYRKTHAGVQITTQATGSGAGITYALKGLAQIGASDAYLAPAQMKLYPSLMNIPLAISAQQINYNIPGLNNVHLKLNGPVLAGIYSGTIAYWNALAIARLNPGVKLPHQRIIPVHRTDSSGDTFIFTQYLTFSTPWWAKQVGYGVTVAWPRNPVGQGVMGNPGMVQMLKETPYSIAYVGISWLRQAEADHLGYAQLENRAHRFVLPTPATIRAAAEALAGKTPPNEAISLVYAPGSNAYPIINYEYAIVNARQSNPVVAQAVRAFLSWCVAPTGGNRPQFLNPVHFLPLPPAIARLSRTQIARIGGLQRRARRAA